MAITDLIARYAVLVDTQRWDAVERLFTADARIDFTTFGAPVMNPAELHRFLAASLPGFRRTQHLMGLPVIDVDGDTASARTPCLNPMVSDGRGTSPVWLIGLWYDDELRRTPEGWRFTARTQDRCYTVADLHDTVLG
jgi:hypothetical protein